MSLLFHLKAPILPLSFSQLKMTSLFPSEKIEAIGYNLHEGIRLLNLFCLIFSPVPNDGKTWLFIQSQVFHLNHKSGLLSYLTSSRSSFTFPTLLGPFYYHDIFRIFNLNPCSSLRILSFLKKSFVSSRTQGSYLRLPLSFPFCLLFYNRLFLELCS